MYNFNRRILVCLIGFSLTCTLIFCKLYLYEVKAKSVPLPSRVAQQHLKFATPMTDEVTKKQDNNNKNSTAEETVRKSFAVMRENIIKQDVTSSKRQFMKGRELEKRENLAPAFHKDAIFITVSGGSAGRLGNRMFQYAALIGLAKHAAKNGLNVIPFVDKHSHLNTLSDAFRLGGAASLTVKNSVMLLEDKPMTYCPRLLKQILPGFNYTAMTYLQSWKYFANWSQDINKEFTFKDEILKEAKTFLQKIISGSGENVTVVGIHVRRRDMALSNQMKRGYAPANATYLQHALEYFRSRFSNALFVVCSDDLGWSEKNIHGMDVRFSNNISPEVDLAILTLCDHNVVTSGSFGWWGAWLAGGHVVYYRNFPFPGTWLASTCTKEDYIPDSWVGLE